MNSHGGKRKGAGRPKGEETFAINCRINEQSYIIWLNLQNKREWLEKTLKREAGV